MRFLLDLGISRRKSTFPRPSFQLFNLFLIVDGSLRFHVSFLFILCLFLHSNKILMAVSPHSFDLLCVHYLIFIKGDTSVSYGTSFKYYLLGILRVYAITISTNTNSHSSRQTYLYSFHSLLFTISSIIIPLLVYFYYYTLRVYSITFIINITFAYIDLCILTPFLQLFQYLGQIIYFSRLPSTFPLTSVY